MAQSKVWLTWLPSGEGAPGPEEAVSALGAVGLDVAGARWVDAVGEHGWVQLAGRLSEPEGIDAWVVVGRAEDFASDSVRYGLSLTTAAVRAGRGAQQPHMVAVGLDTKPTAEGLPTLLKGHRLVGGSKLWPSQVMLGLRKTPTAPADGFLLNVVAHSTVGLWFEVGPREGSWDGVMFGVADAQIQQHAVGARGALPEKTVLERPIDDIQAEVAGAEFRACACANRLEDDTSYWVQVKGQPAKLLIGQHPEVDGEAWVVDLR